MRQFALLATLLLPAAAFGQSTPEPWTKSNIYGDVEVTATPAQAVPGEVVTIKLTITPKLNCTTYPFFAPQTGKNSFTPTKSKDCPLVFIGPIKNPPGTDKKPSAEGKIEDVYKHRVTWEIKAVVLPTAEPTPAPVRLRGLSLLICQTSCLPINPVFAPLEILAGDAKKVPDEYQPWVTAYQQQEEPLPLDGSKDPPAPGKTPDPPTPTPPTVKPAEKPAPTGLIKKATLPTDEYTRRLDELAGKIGEQKATTDLPAGTKSGDFGGLLLAAVFWGFVSLVTPCVFPMIPITVSLFLKQSNQSVAGAARLAGVYCLTIILVLGASAGLLLWLFRALSVNPVMNVGIGLLFTVFALSLFGMYEITLPNFLLRGAEAGRQRGGLIGTVFGAVAFSIVSFSCVAPFLGGFAGLISSNAFPLWQITLAGLTYATAFASPFFVLALVPGLLKKLPRSGGWMDVVKAVMGFLELAAALKFFRTAELRLLPASTYFTYDLVLVGWVVIAAACGAYLLGLFRLPHDEPHERIGVPRLVFALLFLGLGVYLLPGVFKGPDGKPQRPGGVVFAWVDAFLLPEPTEEPWSSDLPDALKKADEGKRLVFVDFTGETCTNCKANEHNVFPRPEVSALLQKYDRVQMYTDDVPAAFYSTAVPTSARAAEGEANLNFQRKVFGTEQLPLYVILEPQPNGGAKVLGVYDEGLINNPQAFLEFLKKPLEGK